MAQELSVALLKRVEKLTETLQFKSCLYLDPRFNFTGSKRLSSIDKELVQDFIVKLNEKISRLRGTTTKHPDTETVFVNNNTSNRSIEETLSNFFDEEYISAATPNSSNILIKELKKLEMREKISILQESSVKAQQFDLLKFWQAQQYTSPLFHAAMVILLAPSTQVSVERAFSAVKLILADNRMGLSSASLEDTLILKLNQELLTELAGKMCDDVV
ncbi:uncharacterized protein LOC131430248 [Malaya genurostris]|uniref:uncharacterized protein LOC131430248 n=1 Tax=Malaya genurostris TaxID=325434 RepID=UPI0026F3D11B|nr:uncharacterized protein LOC131430248 [Malaya genurostris]